MPMLMPVKRFPKCPVPGCNSAPNEKVYIGFDRKTKKNLIGYHFACADCFDRLAKAKKAARPAPVAPTKSKKK